MPTSVQGLTQYSYQPGASARHQSPLSNLSPSGLNLSLAEQPSGLLDIQGLSQDKMLAGPFQATKAMTEFNFLDAPGTQPEPVHPMTKKEFIDNAEGALKGVIGEAGVEGLKAVGGLAHIASGGDVTYNRNLNIEGFDSSSLKLKASVDKGGKLGLEFKASF